MFTCPENDIHSIYLDDELPQEFLADYEEHIKNCPKCQAELETLRKVQTFFANDSKSLELDAAFLNQSFDRLQTKLHFTKVVNTAVPKKRFNNYFIPFAAAAAAVFAVLAGPSRQRNNISHQNVAMVQDKIQVVSRQEPVPITQGNVVVNGNLSGIMNASNASVNSRQMYSCLTSADVFRPQFNESSIKIYIPDMDGFNGMTEASLNTGKVQDISAPVQGISRDFNF